MEEKTLHTLEYDKVLEHLAGYTSFAVSAEKARALRPTSDPDLARRRQEETSEAVTLLATHPDLTIGGVRDIRQQVDLAAHAGVLTPIELLDVKSTLIAARNLLRTFVQLETQFPRLFELVTRMKPPIGLVDAITRTISDRGEVLDTASPRLAIIRRDMRIAHDRLLIKLQRMTTDPKIAPFLQEALVTQRDGRYVIPLRAEFKGRLQAIVHDQSASGATLFVEPLGVVNLNNEYRELQLAERDEERRVLAEISALVGEYATELKNILEVIGELDLILAKGKYAASLQASRPALSPFPHEGRREKKTSRHPGSVIRLYGARHPLLNPETVVPVDVVLDSQTYILVITGPNTGGKTVTLKTVGLLALMAQSGLHIPVEAGSEISVFKEIFADIGDEQSIEQSLSTFSGHITNIIHILKKADRYSLVILDELGAGTDPQEGAALARALLTHLLERGITTLVTTHHPELKAFAHSKPGVINASVEFDLETLQPTFYLTIGLPGRSNALAIAQRLGMPETIITAARQDLDPHELHAESLLDEIQRQLTLAQKARAAAEEMRHEIETLRAELSQRLDRIEDERRKILEQARAEAEERLSALHTELEELRRSLAKARQPLEALQAIEHQVEALKEFYTAPTEREYAESVFHPTTRPVRLGDRVRLRSLNSQGVVTAVGEDEVEIQIGALRVRTRHSELEHIHGDAESSSPVRSKTRKVESDLSAPMIVPSPGMEIDLRGQRTDEALEALERYLDAAFLAGLPFVRVIHGKGTGRLRQAVRESLGGHPHVASFEPGGEKEGGDGVTVAKLRTG